MSFEIFNKETIWDKKGKPPLLRISPYGHIRLSVKAVEILGLKQGDGVSFMVDYRDTGVFYFYKDKNGIPLIHNTAGKKGIDGLQACCRPLCMKLLTHFGYTKNSSFDVTPEIVDTPHGKMWFVLKNNLHKPIQWRKKRIVLE